MRQFFEGLNHRRCPLATGRHRKHAEVADTDAYSPPNPWLRRTLFMLPLILILLALVVHYW